MDYASLLSDLKTYTLREDMPYVTKIPAIIEQGIIRIYNNAKDIGFEKYADIPLAANTFRIAKPPGWRKTISLAITDLNNNKTFLQERTYEYCKTYIPNPALVTATPKYYYDMGINKESPYGNWEIVSNANEEYTVNVIYLSIPQFNAGPNSVNFLTQRYPSLLLYSCLMEASLFLNNEEQRVKYEAMFGKELETIDNINQDRMTDRTVNRDKS